MNTIVATAADVGTNVAAVGGASPRVLDWLVTLPNFLAYFGASVALLVAFVGVYIFFTPHKELTLIKGGNLTAALGFGGALLGFALPMKAVLENAVSIGDNVVWGLVVLVVQALAFLAARAVVGWSTFSAKVEADQRSVGVFVAAVAIAVGLLNAGAVSY